MGPSSKFPNLREFRARAARLSAGDGYEDLPPPPPRADPQSASAPVWLAMALAAAAGLAWLGYDFLGAPQVETGEVASAAPSRNDVRPAHPPAADLPPARSPANSAAVSAELALIAARLDSLERTVTALVATAATPAAASAEIADLRQRLELIESAFGPPTGSIVGAARGDAGREAGALSPFGEAAQLPSRTSPENPLITPGAGAGQSRLVSNFAFAVDLGGFGDIVDLKRYWARVLSQNELLLGNLMPRQVTQIQSDGIRSFRLIAGPLSSVGEAQRLCRQIVLSGSECAQTIDTGEPL